MPASKDAKILRDEVIVLRKPHAGHLLEALVSAQTRAGR